MKKLLIMFVIFTAYILGQACTIGIINGSATTDGRPILWKSRGAGTNVQVFHEDQYTYEYVGSGSGGSEYAWMGMNEAGFAIANAMVGDLNRLPGNGDCMLQALRNYSTIDEFLVFLDSTNVSGRETHTCYVAFDSEGTAVVIEAASNEYWVYDTADSEYGFMTRTSYSYAGSGPPGGDEIMNHVLTDLAQAGPISWQDIFPYILRDYYDFEFEPVSIPYPDYWSTTSPYGYVSNTNSNNMTGFTSAALMHGALPDEEAWLSTMWTILGTPTCGVATPFWAVCPEIPSVASANPTTPLNQRFMEIKDLVYNYSSSYYADSYVLSNSEGNGYWDTILPFETEKFELIDFLRESWINQTPSVNELQSYQNMIAGEAYEMVMNWEFEPDLIANCDSDSTHGDIPFTVHFNNRSLHNPDIVSWDFDADGVIDSVLTENFYLGADWTFSEAGTYSVMFYAEKEGVTDSLFLEDYITASLPNIDYLEASIDTVICGIEEPFEEEFYIYNIGDYPVTLESYHFEPLEGYNNQLYLFDFYFSEPWGQLPQTIEPGDSLRTIAFPLIPVRDYWGLTTVIEADLDTLRIPCLYDQELWQDVENTQLKSSLPVLSNYPNPFNPVTNISWSLPSGSNANSISIFNLKGQLVYEFENLSSEGKVVWDGRNQTGKLSASGIYFYNLYSGNKLEKSERLLLLK